MANVSYNNIVEFVNSGIKKAVKEHLILTNEFTELSFSPEYFITVNIANELKKLNAAYVYLEESMSKSQDPPKKRAPEEWGENKRYDIVVRTSDSFPYAAIEVKNRVYNVSDKVTKDFKRISFAVRSEKNEDSVFRMGVFAFYTVFDGSKSSDSKKESILNLYSNLEKELNEYRGSSKLDNELFDPTVYPHDKSMVWGGGCFILSPP